MPPVGSALAVNAKSGELLRLIDFERVTDRLEDVAGQVHCVRIRHNHLGERVELELIAEAKPRGAFQVVEAVAVLQLLELLLEHEVEG